MLFIVQCFPPVQCQVCSFSVPSQYSVSSPTPPCAPRQRRKCSRLPPAVSKSHLCVCPLVQCLLECAPLCSVSYQCSSPHPDIAPLHHASVFSAPTVQYSPPVHRVAVLVAPSAVFLPNAPSQDSVPLPLLCPMLHVRTVSTDSVQCSHSAECSVRPV